MQKGYIVFSPTFELLLSSQPATSSSGSFQKMVWSFCLFVCLFCGWPGEGNRIIYLVNQLPIWEPLLDKLTKQPTEAWEVPDTWLGKRVLNGLNQLHYEKTIKLIQFFSLWIWIILLCFLLIYASKASGGFLNSIQNLDIVKALNSRLYW